MNRALRRLALVLLTGALLIPFTAPVALSCVRRAAENPAGQIQRVA
ncbi:MAG: hypothetical protein ACJ8CR_39475 [Roseiflexaceae bacterium]